MTNSKTRIGYWPKQIFSKLSENANQVEWGGETGSGIGTSQWPEM